MINNIINNIINKQPFNATKDILVQHSFNKVYNLNILNKRKPKVVQHILASNFIFDLSYGNTFKLKKNIIRAAFQNNFCRELIPLSNKVSLTLVKKVKIQTVQLVLHCSEKSAKPLKKSSLQEISKALGAVNPFLRLLGLKTKTNPLPCFFGKKTGAEFLTLDFKLNNLSVFYKQKKQVQNKRNFLGCILKKKFGFCPRPLVFIKIINEVFSKAIRRGCVDKIWQIKKSSVKTSRKPEERIVATFKKPQKAFFDSNALLRSSLTFDMKNKKSPELNTKGYGYVKDQRIEGRRLSLLKNSSPLAHQKCRLSQIGAAYLDTFKSSEFFDGSLVRANWVLNKFIEQLSKKKMSPRGAMNQQINDIRVLIDKMGSDCPIKGMRITIAGRLGNRKKAMAQKISKFVGKVPLSTFRQRVDYKQGVLPTKFGLIGIKIWVCYANITS